MHRLLAWATFGWHSQSPPSTISRSIKWTYARLSSELTWKKRSICTRRRDIFIWSELGADRMIQDWERLRGRWYSTWESLFMAWSGPRTFGMALLRTSWFRLDSWRHLSTEDCSSSRIKTWSLPQLFCTSMISLPVLMRACLGTFVLRRSTLYDWLLFSFGYCCVWNGRDSCPGGVLRWLEVRISLCQGLWCYLRLL